MAIYAAAHSDSAHRRGAGMGVVPAWWLSRRFKPRDLLLAIYLAWAVSLVLSLVAFGFRSGLGPAARLKTVARPEQRPAQLRGRISRTYYAFGKCPLNPVCCRPSGRRIRTALC